MSAVNEAIAARDAALKNVQHLQFQAGSLSGRAKARQLSPEEIRRVDALYDQYEAANAELAECELDIERATHQDTADSRGRIVPPVGPGASAGGRRLHIPTSARFADLFPGQGQDSYAGRFSGLGEFCLVIASGKQDPRLIQNASTTEGSGVSGGYLVPSQYMAEILDGALEEEVIRPNAAVLPMQSNELAAPGFDFADGTSGKRAGLLLTWGQEAGTLSEQVPVARKITLRAHKAHILCRVSTELAEDAPAFDRQLQTAMIRAVASGLDGAFISGTGAGLPLGILQSPAKIEVAKETSQVAATFHADNAARMMSRISGNSFNRATWIIHQTVLPQVMKMGFAITTAAGTAAGGGAVPVTQGADGRFYIFGRPVAISDACSALGTAGDVILADLSQYLVGLRRDARIEMSRDAYFASDELGFKLTLRADGQGIPAAATKLRDGTTTVSPFVTLATRA